MKFAAVLHRPEIYQASLGRMQYTINLVQESLRLGHCHSISSMKRCIHGQGWTRNEFYKLVIVSPTKR
jgi:hypothetical protein